MSNKARASNDVIALTVLSLLSEEPMHPYQIERVIRERHKEWAMGKTRSLYHAVDRLVADELIVPLETSREGKRPERTVYAITELGREEQQAWLIDLIEQPEPEHPLFLIAVSFLAYLASPAALEALRIRAVALEGQIAGVEVWIRALGQELRLPRPVTIDAELHLVLQRAELAWVRSVVAEIESGKLHWDEEYLRHISR
ncbi:MAG TPA: PadR family transcriptional regulator [Candidatus Dormibacteraeota bacterium]|jgi:DNA-binding PadR family transcriptional regulator